MRTRPLAYSLFSSILVRRRPMGNSYENDKVTG